MLWAALLAAQDDVVGAVKHEAREWAVKTGFVLAMLVGGAVFFGLITLIARLFRKPTPGTAAPAPPSPPAPEPELFDQMFDAARSAAAGDLGDPPGHARVHRWILLLGFLCGGGGLALGLLFVRSELRANSPNTKWGTV